MNETNKEKLLGTFLSTFLNNDLYSNYALDLNYLMEEFNIGIEETEEEKFTKLNEERKEKLRRISEEY